ncbi:hypothetical protein [Cellulosimicrobium arenosum]|nr:hypothetical protein [Cellulosimicrobium arenosum]
MALLPLVRCLRPREGGGMEIFWGVLALVVVVGSTVLALALRREDPGRPWFPAGSDQSWGSRDLDHS